MNHRQTQIGSLKLIFAEGHMSIMVVLKGPVVIKFKFVFQLQLKPKNIMYLVSFLNVVFPA